MSINSKAKRDTKKAKIKRKETSPMTEMARKMKEIKKTTNGPRTYYKIKHSTSSLSNNSTKGPH